MRPTHDDYFITIAEAISRRASCTRRKVGCVLVNSRNNIVSTGYNGYSSGLPNCIDTAHCARSHCQSGEGLDLCAAIHAEMNAMLQAPNTYDIMTCYVTTSPCITCVKLLMNTSCQRVVFRDEYPGYELSKALWESVGREIVQFSK
jgi:dCMP deaminase